MPDANAAAQAAAATLDPKPAHPVKPDRVGEELADDAKIWHVYDHVAREDDERRAKAWDNGLNNVALFAGLFSAVTTAFIIEAQHGLEPDYAQLTFQVLNATNFGEKFIHQPFSVPSSARTVNCLWVASLVLSLSAALISIMGKDWIGMYTARPVCNLRQWAEMRAYRLNCVEQWYMSGVIAAAPVLLHVSLLLFGAGLVLFMTADPLTHRLTLGLSLAAGALYLLTTFSAILFSHSPFQSPATQTIRAAISAIISYLCSGVYLPNSNPLHTLLRNANTMLVGGADDTVSLLGSTPENRQLPAILRPAAVLSNAGGSVMAYMRKIPALLQIARDHFQWYRVHSHLRSIASAAYRIPLTDWFLASTWTDLPADRRPYLVADALSWLSGASQAPDVFRSIVFALGDLDIGTQVGLHTTPAFRTRLRAEIRRTWEQVDFLTLSRFVLADRNTPGRPVLHNSQFRRRFDIAKDSALRCEDGLAAVIVIDPDNIAPSDVERYIPNDVAQPRMLEFLLPYIQQTPYSATDILILLSNRYRKYLILRNLVVQLDQSLSADTREGYAREVTAKYGGTAGTIELLTYLCCHKVSNDSIRLAAVELIMELLRHHLHEHRCLAYLFGSSKLRQFAWPQKDWPSNFRWYLSFCLRNSRHNPIVVGDGQEFGLALARTAVMLLSSRHISSGAKGSWIEFLSCQLGQSRSILDGDGKLDVIRLILETAALGRILHTPYILPDDIGHSGGTAILAAIVSDLCRRLRVPATVANGEQLFMALAFAEVKGPDGDTRTWDLGKWLQVEAPRILATFPSLTTGFQGVHDALVAIYPLCEANKQLRVQWDRIGYPGRPGDIFSDPFLDLSEFFSTAENSRSPRSHADGERSES